jgi:hypothetical protein
LPLLLLYLDRYHNRDNSADDTACDCKQSSIVADTALLPPPPAAAAAAAAAATTTAPPSTTTTTPAAAAAAATARSLLSLSDNASHCTTQLLFDLLAAQILDDDLHATR